MVYSTRRSVLSIAKCCFVLVFFSPFSIAITLLGEERANLICACLVLSVFPSSWCLGRAAACNCGTPWTFFYLFYRVTLYRPNRFVNDNDKYKVQI